jgi:hypothetical protein
VTWHYILVPSFKISYEEERPFIIHGFIYAGYLMIFMDIVCYILVITLGPGTQHKPDIQNGEKVEECKKCQTQKVYGTHHCSVCNRCVPMMDHHCMWTNQCIGHRNREIFLVLLLCGGIGTWGYYNIVVHSNFEEWCMPEAFRSESD